MSKFAFPQTRVPGATRRINPDTLMPALDHKGRPLWNMPAPVRYAEHTKWRRHHRTGERVRETIKVPVYRGTSASYARWVKSQIKRNRRKAAEVQAAEKKSLQEAEVALQNLMLNPGGHNVGI